VSQASPTARQSKGDRARAKLIHGTATLLQRQGYHATGLAQIVEESGAPRGSLYFYFPGGKEELACAALESAGSEWRARIEAVIAGSSDLGEAIVAVCGMLADGLVASGFQLGCPLATVALEAASTSEAVRGTVANHYQGWKTSIAARLEQAGQEAELANKLATFALASIEGALLLSRVSRDVAPLVTVGELLRAMTTLVLSPAPA
jgi:TetR/AcrR family transcriptional repressor of lmrAB and yxaGH operons